MPKSTSGRIIISTFARGANSGRLSTVVSNAAVHHVTKRTVRIGNSSGITRKVLIASGDDRWEWELSPGTYRTFEFTGGPRTLFYLNDYSSGTHFDVYNGHAPSCQNNNFELYDGHIEANGQKYSHDQLRRTGNL